MTPTLTQRIEAVADELVAGGQAHWTLGNRRELAGTLRQIAAYMREEAEDARYESMAAAERADFARDNQDPQA